MLTRTSKFKLRLLGPFNLVDPEGHRIAIPSRKGAALIAMLAVSKDGERARGWVQTKLWGSRELKEASGSLRRELSDLRRRLNDPAYTVLICERDRVRLDLGIVSVDIFETDEEVRTRDFDQPGEFLEGFDIPGEENFEEWLREQRNRLVELAATDVNFSRPLLEMARSQALSSPGLTGLVPSGRKGHPLTVPGSVIALIPPLSIVVLPFASIGSDPDQESFADGVTESLTTDLSRIVGSFVIGRNTAFTYKGKALDLKQVRRELNVRYALQGSVQKGGERFRINVQLADTETGANLWAERFDKTVTGLFEVQDEIVSRLANELEAQLTEQEARRAERSPHPSSMELYFQGKALLNKGWIEEYLAPARVNFERAIALDPRNVDAVVGTATIDLIVSVSHLGGDRVALLARAEETIMGVLSRAPNHAFAHLLLGALLISTNRAAQGIDECERALLLDRNLAEAHAEIGLAKQLTGRAAETEAHIREAFRLSPRDVFGYRWLALVGIAKLVLNEDAEALVWMRRSVEANRNYPIAHFIIGGALALTGSLDQARGAAKTGLALNPDFTIRRFRESVASNHPTYLFARERVCHGMRMAGIPDS